MHNNSATFPESARPQSRVDYKQQINSEIRTISDEQLVAHILLRIQLSHRKTQPFALNGHEKRPGQYNVPKHKKNEPEQHRAGVATMVWKNRKNCHGVVVLSEQKPLFIRRKNF